MSVLGSQLVATSIGPTEIRDLIKFFGYTYAAGDLIETPMAVMQSGDSNAFFRVETWFEDGCRNCTHQKAKGLTFLVGQDTEFLMKNGSYLKVQDLQDGHRLLAADCACGHEVVKAVTLQMPEADVQVSLFTATGAENFALSSPGSPNKVVIRV